jgi:hypothetical protein
MIKYTIEFTHPNDSSIWLDNIATNFSSVEVAQGFYNSRLRHHQREAQKYRICISEGTAKNYIYLN